MTNNQLSVLFLIFS